MAVVANIEGYCWADGNSAGEIFWKERSQMHLQDFELARNHFVELKRQNGNSISDSHKSSMPPIFVPRELLRPRVLTE